MCCVGATVHVVCVHSGVFVLSVWSLSQGELVPNQ